MLLHNGPANTPVPAIGTVRIKVVGVGGAGVNAVRRMAGAPVPGIELLGVNTDAASLDSAPGVRTIVLGATVTRGLGAGGNPETGRLAAEEAAGQIKQEFQGVDLVFVAAGLGGGTGTGAAPVVAALAQEAGALTIGVVTTPFQFEGARRRLAALKGLAPLREHLDTLIVVNNQRLPAMLQKNATMQEAFARADQVMVQAIAAVSRIISLPGEVNLDFADVRTVIRGGGVGLIGIGRAEGERRLVRAAQAALSEPLVGASAEGAKGILFFISAGSDVTLSEVQEAGAYLAGLASAEAEVFFGLSTQLEGRSGRVEVMIIATRLPEPAGLPAPRAPDPVAPFVLPPM